LVTTARVQREILAEIERRPAMPLVLYTAYDTREEQNQSRLSSGVDILDRRIRREYDRSRIIGPYEIWERKSSKKWRKKPMMWLATAPPPLLFWLRQLLPKA
jgi:hypothetical protein